MVKKMKEISPGRYRESFGRYYEEFVVGDVYEHRPGRTITQSDNIWFTLLTMNQHPLHIDDEYGKGTVFVANTGVRFHPEHKSSKWFSLTP